MEQKHINTAKLILMNFMAEMYTWEKKYFPLMINNANNNKYRELAKQELSDIYKRYLTPKKRKTGRLAGPNVGSPPEYDPEAERIETISEENGRVIILTQETTGFKERLRYTLKQVHGEWRIDKKESFYQSKNKWVNYIF